jgi:predicted PurR-regulated permease PerM
VFLGFTIFTSFFLLKDGPSMGRWIERHMGMQPAEARIVTGDILQALRKYFFGLTLVGASTRRSSRSARSCSASRCSARSRW